MAVINKVFVPGKQAEAAQVTQYTAVNCKAIIDKFTITNTTAGYVNFSINLVQAAGSSGAQNRILSVRPIAPGECYLCPEVAGHMLESGGFISTLAGSAAALTIYCSGREIT